MRDSSIETRMSEGVFGCRVIFSIFRSSVSAGILCVFQGGWANEKGKSAPSDEALA